MRNIVMMGAALALLLAGCTGSFQVNQTAPLRVQLEGAPQSLQVASTDTAPKAVVVESEGPSDVEVQVDVTRTGQEVCQITITIRDEATNQTLETRTITVGGNETSSPTQTQTVTQTTTTTQTVTQPGASKDKQSIKLNVHGNGNIIVLASAQTGSATVDISGSATSTAGTGASGNSTPPYP